jgi:hypothetical protein
MLYVPPPLGYVWNSSEKSLEKMMAGTPGERRKKAASPAFMRLRAAKLKKLSGEFEKAAISMEENSIPHVDVDGHAALRDAIKAISGFYKKWDAGYDEIIEERNAQIETTTRVVGKSRPKPE